MADKIDNQARLVSALADTMDGRMWPSDILARCAQMREAISEIERIARESEGGSR